MKKFAYFFNFFNRIHSDCINFATVILCDGVFDAYADFSGIREDIYISRVLHKAVIEVNEEGSEAAAAIVVETKELAAVEALTFIADRPFVFIIADDETESILFMGKLYKV